MGCPTHPTLTIRPRRLGNIPNHHPHIALDAYIVMPNHLHAIIDTTQRFPGRIPETFGAPVHGSVPTVLRSFTAAATRFARINGVSTSTNLWQGGHWPRVISDEDELHQIRRYIKTHPPRPYR